MAEKKSIAPEVREAESAVHGPIAEAHSLVSIWMKNEPDSEAFACLAVGVMERFCDAFDELHHQLLKHGFPSSEERGPLEPQPLAEMLAERLGNIED